MLRKATDLDGAPPKGQRPESTDGLQPKILDESKNNDGAQSEEVRKHNEEFLLGAPFCEVKAKLIFY